MVDLKDLKAKRAVMTQGEWEEYSAPCCPDMGGIDAGTRRPAEACVGRYGHPMMLANATGIVATHNAADVLIEIAEAASVVMKMFDDPNTGPWWSVAGADARFVLRAALAKIKP